MRGRSCPKAWVCPVPERVCSQVLSASSKSLASRAGTRKSRHASKNLPDVSRESLSVRSLYQGVALVDGNELPRRDTQWNCVPRWEVQGPVSLEQKERMLNQLY